MINLWSKFCRWSRMRKLRGLYRKMVAQSSYWRRERVRHARALVEIDAHLARNEPRLREVRAAIARLEKPQLMLDEALARRTDIH